MDRPYFAFKGHVYNIQHYVGSIEITFEDLLFDTEFQFLNQVITCFLCRSCRHCKNRHIGEVYFQFHVPIGSSEVLAPVFYVVDLIQAKTINPIPFVQILETVKELTHL